MATGGSKLAVVAALVGNFIVMIAKFIAFLVTRSGAMLSESVHSLADFLNQLLLLIGIATFGHSSRPWESSSWVVV